MIGLFHRLASRAMGNAPVAEPIVPSVFAPVGRTGQMEMPVEQAEVTAMRPLKASTEASSLPSVQSRAADNIIREVFETREREREVNRTIEPSVRPPNKSNERQPPLPDRRSIPQPPTSTVIRQDVMVEHVADPPVPVRPHSFFPPAPMPTMARGERHETDVSEASSSPVVRVSIGRIEVRAEMPAPTAAPALVQKQRPSGMSLDEYAKLRAEGKR